MQKASFLSSVRIKVCFDMDCFNSSILMENAGKRSGWKCGENSWGGFYTAFIQSGIIVSMHSGEKSDKCGENILRCCFLAWASSQSATYKMIDHLLTPFSPELTIISVFPAGRPNCKQITKCTKLGIWERCTHGVGVHGSLPRALFTRKNVKNLPKIYSRQDIAQMKYA